MKPAAMPEPETDLSADDQLEEVVEAYFEELTPEQIEQLPIGEAVRGSVRRELRAVVREEFYSGPLPPPEVLRQYAELYSQAPEIIFEGFRKQVDHRLKIEDYAVTSNAKRSTEGLRLGFVITVLCLLCGVYLIVNGYSTEGLAIIAIDLVALAGVFVYGSQQQKRERQQKNQTMVDVLRGRRGPETPPRPQETE